MSFRSDNDNLTELKVLVEKMGRNRYYDEGYELAISDIAKVINEADLNIKNQKNRYTKLKCYENVCSKIRIILNKIK